MAHFARALAVLLAGACPLQAIEDHTFLVQRKLALGQDEDEACPPGYKLARSNVVGWDPPSHGKKYIKDTIEDCAADCDALDKCLVFEWSKTTRKCNRNEEAEVSLHAFRDGFFCKKLQLVVPVADPGYAGFVFRRVPGSIGVPSTISISVGDCGADGECYGLWGTDAPVKISLLGGIVPDPGDVAVTSVEFGARARNKSSIVAFLMPDALVLNGTCALCGGTCDVDAVSAFSRAKIWQPTVLDAPEYCSKGSLVSTVRNITDLSFSGEPMAMPDLTEGLVEGKVLVSTGLRSASGELKAWDTFGFFLAEEKPTKNYRERAARTKGQKIFRSLPGVLFHMLQQSVQRALTGPRSVATGLEMARASPRRGRSGAEPGFGFSVSAAVRKVMNGVDASGVSRNFSVSTDSSACAASDGRGSFACNFPFRNNTFSSMKAAHFDFNFEEGDMVNVTVTPHIKGVPQPQIIPPTTIVAPACGAATTLEVNGDTFEVDARRCGPYGFSYKSDQWTTMNLDLTGMEPDLSIFYALNMTLDDLLPAFAQIDLLLTKPSGQVVLDMGVSVGYDFIGQGR